MLTQKDYCDYETCVALKELGYKVPTSAYYMPNNNQLIFVSNPCRGSYVIDCFYSHNSLPKDVMTSNYIDAPTRWEAQKWLREEKDMNVYVKAFNGEGWYYIIQNYKGARIYPPLTRILVLCHSYEESLSEGIKEAIKHIEKYETL